MMCALFDTETLMRVHDNNLYKEALAQGKAEGMEKGMEKGIAQTMISSIKAIMTSLKYTAEQAMEIFNVPQ